MKSETFTLFTTTRDYSKIQAISYVTVINNKVIVNIYDDSYVVSISDASKAYIDMYEKPASYRISGYELAIGAIAHKIDNTELISILDPQAIQLQYNKLT